MKFLKKNKVTKTDVKTILCIPGVWSNRSEIVTSIAEKNMGEFLFVGNILLNIQSNMGFELEIGERDERLMEAFRWGGMVNRVSDEFLNAIDQHTHVIYLIGDGGGLDCAKSLAEAGLAILNSGGLGVKVETSGIAFEKSQWTDLLLSYCESNLYRLFVIDSISDKMGNTYSCGMHNLGLKDTIVAGVDFQQSVDLIATFSLYQLIEKPTLKPGQTFSCSVDSPVFKILDEMDQPNKGDEYFENPFGVWRLHRQ